MYMESCSYVCVIYAMLHYIGDIDDFTVVLILKKILLWKISTTTKQLDHRAFVANSH